MSCAFGKWAEVGLEGEGGIEWEKGKAENLFIGKIYVCGRQR